MAEAVKNNSRKRRPPSHLRQGYNQDNYEPNNPHNFGGRELFRQSVDPSSTQTMAKLLTKFINSSNKKILQSQAKRKEQEGSSPQIKPLIQSVKYTTKQDSSAKQEKRPTSSKIQQNSASRQMGYRTDQIRRQQRISKISMAPIQPPSVNQTKHLRNQTSTIESSLKSALNNVNLQNFDSLAKMSKQQFLKMVPEKYDLNILRDQMIPTLGSERSKMLQRLSQSGIKSSSQLNRFNQFRQGTKLFKRASFHVGIAYNIHIQNIKNRNPNFSPDELDPTYVSRKMKQQNAEYLRKQTQKNLKLHQQDQAALKKQQRLQKQTKANQETNNKNNPIQICDEQQQEAMKQQQINKYSQQKNIINNMEVVEQNQPQKQQLINKEIINKQVQRIQENQMQFQQLKFKEINPDNNQDQSKNEAEVEMEIEEQQKISQKQQKQVKQPNEEKM